MVKRIFPDTNIWSYWLRGTDAGLMGNMEKAFDHLLMSSVVYSELFFGAQKSGNPRHLSKVVALGEIIPIVDFKKEDAKIYGEIRANLEKKGNRIGPYDLQIAAQSLRLSATLITHNHQEFSRVPNLKWEDWVLAKII